MEQLCWSLSLILVVVIVFLVCSEMSQKGAPPPASASQAARRARTTPTPRRSTRRVQFSGNVAKGADLADAFASSSVGGEGMARVDAGLPVAPSSDSAALSDSFAWSAAAEEATHSMSKIDPAQIRAGATTRGMDTFTKNDRGSTGPMSRTLGLNTLSYMPGRGSTAQFQSSGCAIPFLNTDGRAMAMQKQGIGLPETDTLLTKA